MQLPAPIIRHSCNGLLVLHMRLSNSYSVYNPATRQFKELPPLNFNSLGVVLSFDPSRFEGFKAISVVRLPKSPSRALGIFSYSSHESCWNKWNGNPFYEDSDSINFSNGVYWNGAVHWVSVSEDSFYFNIENEKLSNFSLPPISNDDVVYEQLCEFNGELHYMQGDDLFLSCKVYALLGYEQGWVLRYNVNGYDILRVVDLVFSQPYLVIYEGRKQMLIHCGTKVMAYDLETNTWRTLCVDVCESGYLSNWSKGFYYTATLALF